MIYVMGILREVQGKQFVQGIGHTVLLLVCVSLLALSGGCSRPTVTGATTSKSAPAASVVTTQPTNPSTAATAATSGTESTTGTAATEALAAPLMPTAASPATTSPAALVPVLYENVYFGVRASETSGWILHKAFDIPSLRVVFASEKTQAILSVLSSDKTGKAILGELLRGLGDVEVIARTDTFLEVRTRYTDSMRTIAYVEREGRFNYLLVFVTPDNGLEQRRDAIASLIAALDYLG